MRSFQTGVRSVVSWATFSKNMAMESTLPQHWFSKTFEPPGLCALDRVLVGAVAGGEAEEEAGVLGKTVTFLMKMWAVKGRRIIPQKLIQI